MNQENSIHHLEDKVKNLEHRIKELELQAKHSKGAAYMMPDPSRAEEKPKKKRKPNAFILWIKTDWLMKLGAFLLLLALAWFVNFAFVNNWIGPVGRITIGIVVGALIMTASHLIMEKYRGPGQVLSVLGGVMILLTLFAARSVYDFFSPTIALAAMSLVVILMAVIAIVHKSKSVAFLALIGGAAAPLLLDAPDPNYLALLSYIFLLDLGVLGVVAMRSWRSLIPLAILITGGFSFAFDHMPDPQVWIFMALFFGLFFAATLSAVLRTKESTLSDLMSTGLNGLILLGWVSAFVPDHMRGLIMAGITLLLVVVSYLLLQIKSNAKPLFLNAGLVVLFLGVATSFELQGPDLVVAFAIEAFVVIFLARYLLRSSLAAHSISMLQVIPVILSLESLERFQYSEVFFSRHFFAILFVFISLVLTAILLNASEKKDKNKITWLQTGLAVIYGLTFIWLITHNLLSSDDVANGVSLVIYTVIGIGAFVTGFLRDNKVLNISGGLLLGCVVLRLLIVEVWQMPLSGRIVTFFAIGALLISTAFFQKKHSPKPSHHGKI